MSKVIKIRKGLDIRLKGTAEKIFIKAEKSGSYSLKPTDFPMMVPKLLVKPEQKVRAGEALFFDKKRPDIKFTSPVSGVVSEIVRGDRRVIREVIVIPDERIDYLEFGKKDPNALKREEVTELILKSGTWPFIRQRPYGIIANPEDTPDAIHISAFDTAPLAPDYDFIAKDLAREFHAGVGLLSKLTKGKIHVNVDADYPPSETFIKAKGVTINRFHGPHPSGNVGIQMHHLTPLTKGVLLWYINPQDVITLGRLVLSGIFDFRKTIALTGSEVIKPRYYKIIGGTSIDHLVKDNVTGDQLRYISGNVLTGTKINSKGFLGFYDSQITVIPEGDHYEFIGWAKPGFSKFSHSRSFWSWLTPDKEYRLDTNLNGGHRAFVMTGEYEKVLPMSIFPVQLLKAILAEDIEAMEKLGIYEVIEEDMALCEYVCTSKMEVQKMIRQGINLMIKELG